MWFVISPSPNKIKKKKKLKLVRKILAKFRSMRVQGGGWSVAQVTRSTIQGTQLPTRASEGGSYCAHVVCAHVFVCVRACVRAYAWWQTRRSAALGPLHGNRQRAGPSLAAGSSAHVRSRMRALACSLLAVRAERTRAASYSRSLFDRVAFFFFSLLYPPNPRNPHPLPNNPVVRGERWSEFGLVADTIFLYSFCQHGLCEKKQTNSISKNDNTENRTIRLPDSKNNLLNAGYPLPHKANPVFDYPVKTPRVGQAAWQVFYLCSYLSNLGSYVSQVFK